MTIDGIAPSSEQSIAQRVATDSEAQPTNHSDEVAALLDEEASKEYTVPSGGEVNTEGVSGGLWTESRAKVGQSVDSAEAETTVTEEAPRIIPGRTEISTQDAALASVPEADKPISMDGVFASTEATTPKDLTNEDGQSNPSEPLDPDMKVPENLGSLSDERAFKGTPRVPEFHERLGQEMDKNIADSDRFIDKVEKALGPVEETLVEKRINAIRVIESQIVEATAGEESLLREKDEINSREAKAIAEAEGEKRKALNEVEVAEAKRIEAQNYADRERAALEPKIEKSRKTIKVLEEAVVSLRGIEQGE